MRSIALLFAGFFSSCTLFTGFLFLPCGNGVTEPGEQCDDGNNANNDGCDASCLEEGICGDGVVEAGEACDDGNQSSGDGCRADCDGIEACGDGLLDDTVGEECDDGNLADGDGCAALCVLELCGDGIINNNTETCDDGNAIDGDGCDSDCQTSCDVLAASFGAAAFTEDIATGHCYLLSPTNNNWQTAKADCATLNGNATFPGHLATITSAKENALVRGLLASPLWIGLTDLKDDAIGSDEGRFRWVTRERASSFFNFEDAQPNDLNGQDCVAYFQDGSTWSDEDCADLKPYVCEVDFGKQCGNGVVEQGEVCDDKNTVAGDGCDATCSTFNCNQENGLVRQTSDVSDGCFVIFTNGLDAASAEQDCTTRGGHLATVTTAEEDSSLALLNGAIQNISMYIGLDDVDVEGTFTWVNGETFGFTHFLAPQPDNFNDEDCTVLRSTDDWNDLDCATPLVYICEF